MYRHWCSQTTHTHCCHHPPAQACHCSCCNGATLVLKLATVGAILVSTIHTVIAATILLLKLATAGATLVLKLAQTCHCSTGGANICHCLCYIGAPKLPTITEWLGQHHAATQTCHATGGTALQVLRMADVGGATYWCSQTTCSHWWQCTGAEICYRWRHIGAKSYSNLPLVTPH